MGALAEVPVVAGNFGRKCSEAPVACRWASWHSLYSDSHFCGDLGREASGRLQSHVNIQRVRIKLLAFSVMLEKKVPLIFIFKKSKLPIDMWGQIFNLAVTLNRNTQFEMM